MASLKDVVDDAVNSGNLHGSISSANPSFITQGAIDKAIAASAGVINARLDGMEKAVEVFQADLTRVPTTVDRQILALREMLEVRISGMAADMAGMHKSLDGRHAAAVELIGHLRDLMVSKIEEQGAVTTERFLGVAAQFSERDTRTDQRAGDTKLAVDAAFAAAKEATAKIEAGFTKQIDAMINIIDTKTSNLSGGLSDIKERVTALEGRMVNIGSQSLDNRNNSSDQRATLALIISAIAIVVLIALHFVK